MSKPRRLPRIPATLPTILGPARVELVPNLRDENDARLLGSCNRAERLVKIASEPPRVIQWHTYWHEWAHMLLADAGVETPKELVEAICDAVGNARTREMLDA